MSYTAFSLNGWGATLLDSIDTMILLRLDGLVEKSIIHVSKLKLDLVRDVSAVIHGTYSIFLLQNSYVQFFETVIRYLGGLLSAYALTGNAIYVTHADELGMRLLPIFNTTSGLPPFSVNMHT